MITVSPISMERLIRLNGFTAKRSGAPIIHESELLVALEILV